MLLYIYIFIYLYIYIYKYFLGKEYYLTCENVIVNKELGIEGVLRDGKVLRKR